jgi:cellulose synthase (UDP-forming)
VVARPVIGKRWARRTTGTTPWSGAWGDGLPAPESPARRAAIRGAAVAALVTTLAYLAWRVAFTMDGATWWLAVVLLVVETHAVVSLGTYAFDLWDLDAAPPALPAGAANLRVAVLIPTYNESREILLPTIAAAVAIAPAHETWVLDDGARPWVAELATHLGARYRARTEHSHAKAGNINALLPELDVDLIAVFDADHVAHGSFLFRTMPYFADPLVALVQTPQDFYNVTSYEHVELASGRRFSEQELFYRALAAGRNRWNAAFWCGTNAVIRLAALRDVGGWPLRRSPRTSTRRSGCTVTAGAPSTTTRSSPAACPPERPPSSSASGCAGGPEPCRSCASRIRPSYAG